MKEITMTSFDGKDFMKVLHSMEEVIVGMDVFQIKKAEVIQINRGILSSEEEGKLLSTVYDRMATIEELEMAEEIMKDRERYALNKVVQFVEQVGGMKLLSLCEVGGKMFAYTEHDTLQYPRLAEVILTPGDLPPDFMEVQKELLPFVCESIANVVLTERNKAVTLQIGEGIFVRLRRQSATVFATVVVLETEDNVIQKISAPLGFAMKQQDGHWHVMTEEENLEGKMNDEMQKAFGHVMNQLAMSFDESKRSL